MISTVRVGSHAACAAAIVPARTIAVAVPSPSLCKECFIDLPPFVSLRPHRSFAGLGLLQLVREPGNCGPISHIGWPCIHNNIGLWSHRRAQISALVHRKKILRDQKYRSGTRIKSPGSTRILDAIG